MQFLCIVDFHIYTGKPFPLPVHRYFIMFLQYFEEVLGMTFDNIFNAKVVNNQENLDWSPPVSPKFRGCEGFIVISLVETFA